MVEVLFWWVLSNEVRALMLPLMEVWVHLAMIEVWATDFVEMGYPGKMVGQACPSNYFLSRRHNGGPYFGILTGLLVHRDHKILDHKNYFEAGAEVVLYIERHY